MDKKVLKAAVDTMRELGLSEIHIKDSETEVTLKRELTAAAPVAAPAPVAASVAAPVAAPNDNPADDSGSLHSFINCTEVKSPLIGVFYESPSPEAPPFVRVGDAVKKGDILCVVEAMKMMNDICAEQDGTVMDICAENGAMVEYGQTLFKISSED